MARLQDTDAVEYFIKGCLASTVVPVSDTLKAYMAEAIAVFAAVETVAGSYDPQCRGD